jgi:hypothetical protein
MRTLAIRASVFLIASISVAKIVVAVTERVLRAGKFEFDIVLRLGCDSCEVPAALFRSVDQGENCAPVASLVFDHAMFTLFVDWVDETCANPPNTPERTTRVWLRGKRTSAMLAKLVNDEYQQSNFKCEYSGAKGFLSGLIMLFN